MIPYGLRSDLLLKLLLIVSNVHLLIDEQLVGGLVVWLERKALIKTTTLRMDILNPS